MRISKMVELVTTGYGAKGMPRFPVSCSFLVSTSLTSPVLYLHLYNGFNLCPDGRKNNGEEKEFSYFIFFFLSENLWLYYLSLHCLLSCFLSSRCYKPFASRRKKVNAVHPEQSLGTPWLQWKKSRQRNGEAVCIRKPIIFVFLTTQIYPVGIY